MNLKEAAGKIGISEGTARRWIKVNRLEATTAKGLYGIEYSISEEAVESALASTRTPVIIQSNEPAVPLADMQRMIESAMKRSMGVLIRDAVDESNQTMTETVRDQIESSGRANHAEIEELKAELRAIRELLEQQKKPEKLPLREKLNGFFRKKGTHDA